MNAEATVNTASEGNSHSHTDIHGDAGPDDSLPGSGPSPDVESVIRDTLNRRANRDPNLDCHLALEELALLMAIQSTNLALRRGDPLQEKSAHRWIRACLQIGLKRHQEQKMELQRVKLHREHQDALRDLRLKRATVKPAPDDQYPCPRETSVQTEPFHEAPTPANQVAFANEGSVEPKGQGTATLIPNARPETRKPTSSTPSSPGQQKVEHVDCVEVTQPTAPEQPSQGGNLVLQALAQCDSDAPTIPTATNKLQPLARVELVSGMDRILLAKETGMPKPSVTAKGILERMKLAA